MMEAGWVITNINSGGKRMNLNNFHISNAFSFKKAGSVNIFIDGYIVPRYEVFDRFRHLSQHELISTLFESYGTEFIKKIKGSFILIIQAGEQLFIANDYHSFRKFFYYQDRKNIIISNDIFRIQSMTGSDVDNNSIVLYELMEHFACGKTIFKGIKYSDPATLLAINTSSNEIRKHSYYDLLNNISPDSVKLTWEDFSTRWTDILGQYIEYLKPRSISLTLTGGNDSRMILAGLYNKKTEVNVFSFGNPASFDCIVSEKVAARLGYKHNNYYVEPTAEWFSNYANKVLRIGNSLINIHRAHRLYAIENEKSLNPDVDMLFCGFMGGDYIKGLSYDNYITPRIFNEYEFGANKKDLTKVTETIISGKYLKTGFFSLKEIISELEASPFFTKENLEIRELKRLYYLVGSMHDTQDISLFNSEIPYVINPFMDLDFLEPFFCSRYSFLSDSSKLADKCRIDRSKFQILVTDRLSPDLSEIEYSKKGYYNAKEYINYNPVILTFLRLTRIKKHKQYPSNFPYGKWFNEYLKDNLTLDNHNSSLPYNCEELIHEAKKVNKMNMTEGELHLFTNPINVFLNSKIRT